MKTFLLIIKILPWALSVAGGVIAYFKNKKAENLYEQISLKSKTIVNLKDIIVTQIDDLDNKSHQIAELMRINKKYEKKKTAVKNSKTATSSMARTRP